MMGIRIFLILAAVLLVAVFLEIYRETHSFRVTRYTVNSGKMKGFGDEIRILFFGDLHNMEYGKHNERLFRAAARENPDLILIGGDMLVGKPDVSYDPALKFVQRLTELCPVFYANGNHEQRMKEEPWKYSFSYESYREQLIRKGTVFLENESREITIRGKKLVVSGLELPLVSYVKFRKDRISGSTVSESLGFTLPQQNPNREAYYILLAHNPTYMDAYKEWGADLILSGHLHGGIARIPGIGGVITPQAFLFPKYSGEMTVEGDQTIIVSKGLGTHTVNIRFMNMPELVSVRIHG